ncbi:hypothetical protein Tgr7_1077 [Thioalkalivibrio sulfidiphilus HL-EbGr7]|uniref:Outer membrane protein beta-barrel domain-containing protein n=1 Tax=Thioalkalivibrio sulfidiphilus (strain HL-EbGR7) TaxID=396588 RepID=B8GPJ7_THISH|nr:hypothetical protein [Thioalkalivibrio sulfidiphilus]ACL72164.1 hypothetical protein Tgr7_1077 [Thioalkalivibrio sulfidiphilus HL-EbGr7]
MNKTRICAWAMLACVLWGTAAMAESETTGYQVGVFLETYPDSWQLSGRHHDPLLTTPNSRTILNAHLDNFLRGDSGYLFGVDGRMQWARSDPLSELPMRLEADLRTLQFQALGGYRFGAHGDAVRYDLRMGLGYQGLSREALAGSGLADEDLGLLYTQFSGGPRFSSGGWQGFLELGVRMPLSLTDAGVYGGADPAEANGLRSSGFISFQNQFQLGDSSALRLNLYYDSQRYGLPNGRGSELYGDDASNARDRDVFGVEMGVRF